MFTAEPKNSIYDIIQETFLFRENPQILGGNEDNYILKKWLCDQQSRRSDICIVGTDHYFNGVDVNVVVHVLPADCPLCGLSNTNPVIITRAKAVLILAKYQRLDCTCGWKHQITLSDAGWSTPKNQSDDERDESLKDSVGESISSSLRDSIQKCRHISSQDYHEQSLERSLSNSVTSIGTIEKTNSFTESCWNSLNSIEIMKEEETIPDDEGSERKPR